MKPALLLIDLQNDFLRAPCLEPAAGEITHGAVRLLQMAREAGIPVFHIWTTVNASGKQPDVRMLHWKEANKWSCVEGTQGHATPHPLQPHENETVIHKQFFSGFENKELHQILQNANIDTVLLAGVHLHGCIRASALDAYALRYRVLIMQEAIGSDDVLQAAITRRYLEKRCIEFVSTDDLNAQLKHSQFNNAHSAPLLPAAIIDGEPVEAAHEKTIPHYSPIENDTLLWRVAVCEENTIESATQSAQKAWKLWKGTPLSTRIAALHAFAELLNQNRETLALQITQEIGKPITQARGEIDRSVALIHSTLSYADEPLHKDCTLDSIARFRPLGVAALISPWNNPVAIPVGKIAPAIFYGNALVWKPSPPASSIAMRVVELWREVAKQFNIPSGLLNLLCGDDTTARRLMENRNINAVTMTGSSAAGYAAQEICATRRIPLQAELGGNNAAIVWRDCDLQNAAQLIAEGAFGFAGQRCTANRRVIVDNVCYDKFVQLLEEATRALKYGHPCEDHTQVGPMISVAARHKASTRIEQARSVASKIVTPHDNQLDRNGAYFRPTVVCCDDADAEIVQEESFAPILVVQRAHKFEHALELCNSVQQGLVAALFSHSSTHIEQFMEEAQAGILKINRTTADANAQSPFGGWKSSSVGPAEHGLSNREFWTRTQTVYGS